MLCGKIINQFCFNFVPLVIKTDFMFRTCVSFLIIIFSCSMFLHCSRAVPSAKKANTEKSVNNSVTSPPCLIYKTRADYTNNVPVILNEDRTTISSYPDIKDVWYKGKLATPSILNDGFLLDNRGIGPNVAFLSITYEKYAAMEKTPSVSELMALILDKDPLTELYQCGIRSQYSDPVKELNKIISSGAINSCKRLK
jgi:hypothetical protein